MLILDIQGFQDPMKKFIVKELAVRAVRNNDCACLLFEPPYEWCELPMKYKKTNRWLINNHHGIPWDAGFISYDEVEATISKITEGVKILFVNGLQKKQWLESYTSKLIIDLNDLGCSKAKNMSTPSCWIHREHSLIDNYTCAFENCCRIAEWYQKYFTLSLNPSLNLHNWIQDMLVKQSNSINFMKSFLLEYAWQNIDELWGALSERLRNMNEIEDYRRCYQHHPVSTLGEDVADGPAPLTKNCSICRLLNQEFIDQE